MKYRTIISLEPKQIFILKRLSAETGESISELIRKAVSFFIRKKEKNPAELLLQAREKLINEYKESFKKTPKNLSRKIDKLLYDI